jgi:hypothetical protein
MVIVSVKAWFLQTMDREPSAALDPLWTVDESQEPFKMYSRTLSASHQVIRFVIFAKCSWSRGNISRNFCVCEETFRTCYTCREAVKLLRFLLSPYSLIETCSNVHGRAFAEQQIWGWRKFIFGGRGIIKFENPRVQVYCIGPTRTGFNALGSDWVTLGYGNVRLSYFVLGYIVAARSKAWTVFARSDAGIVGSNPTQGMDVCIVCVYSVFLLFCE